jgi:hypothetical protein
VGEDSGPVGWLERDFFRKEVMGTQANPSERELFQLIEDHYADWCKCERGGDNGLFVFHTKASSEITFDWNEYLDEWGIPPDEEPPRWIA